MEKEFDSLDFNLEDIINEFSKPSQEMTPPPEAEPAAPAAAAEDLTFTPESEAPQKEPGDDLDFGDFLNARKQEEAPAPEEKSEEAENGSQEPAAASEEEKQEEPGNPGDPEAPAKEPDTRLDAEEAPEAAKALDLDEILKKMDETLEPTKVLDIGEIAKTAEQKETTADTTVWEAPAVQAAAEAADDTAVWNVDDILKETKTQEEQDEHQAAMEARSRLQLLKKKLVEGPEKRYYDLSEVGVIKLQTAIALNLIIVLLSLAGAALMTMNLVPENRIRLVIFSQVLALLVSALLGSAQMVESLIDLFKGKFTVNTLLHVTFLACLADAFFCFRELRVPCCAAFAMEMTFSMLGTYYRRATELSQMDTLRKASKLVGISRVENFYDGRDGLVRREGDVDDFWENYQSSSTPQKIQNMYAFFCLIASLAIAALAATLHGPSVALQVLSAALMLCTPVGAFIVLSRPTALLEKRLHMVGTVICGWQGVRRLVGRTVFPLYEEDLFPVATTKLNGVKFYGARQPDDVIAYTASVIREAGGGLSDVFEKIMTSRNIGMQPVLNLRDYGTGGLGAEVRGEPVLVGTHEFLTSMGVEIPSGTVVSQAVYASISGKLVAVYAISYAKMRSASGGLVSLGGCRKVMPIMLSQDFMLTERFIADRFAIKTKGMLFPTPEVREAMLQIPVNPGTDCLALSTRSELISSVYAVTGANALSRACRAGLFITLISGIVGLLSILALAILGQSDLLTPLHIMAFNLIWLLPSWLVTNWAKTV